MPKQTKKPKTKYGFTRQYHISLSYKQIDLYDKAIKTQNMLYQYALKYWYKTYGRKHIGRPLPRKMAVKYMNNTIKAGFIKEKYNLNRWNVKKLSLSSHAADEFLKTAWTNFVIYHQHLVDSSKMSAKAKYNFKMNITKDKKGRHKNPSHRSWYRKGSMNFLRPGNSFRTITSQKLPNEKTRLVSAHHINLADFGDVIVFENLKNIDFREIALSKIKRLADGTFRLQLTFARPKKRIPRKNVVGLDWNMAHNEFYHSSDDKAFVLPQEIVDRANGYEDQINRFKSLRDLEINKQGRKTNKAKTYDRKQKRLSARRANLLTNTYRHMVHEIVDKYDTFIIENIDIYEMRRKKNLVKKQNQAKNRKLALLKPYELAVILESLIDKQNKTLIKIDPYKTSKVCHKCKYVYQDLHVGEKKWKCTNCGAEWNRDYNAALNIKEWGLHPENHQKIKEYEKVKPGMVAMVC